MTDRQLAEKMAEALEDARSKMNMARMVLNNEIMGHEVMGTSPNCLPDMVSGCVSGGGLESSITKAEQALAAFKQHTLTPTTPCTESSKDQN